MPNPAIYPIRKFQVGKEAVAGTAVPATWQLVGDAVAMPEIDRYFSDYPRGVRAPYTDGGVPIRQGFKVQRKTDCRFEELLYTLNTSMATTVPSGTTPKIHTATPILTAAPATGTATAEWEMGDGTNHFIQAQAAYGWVHDWTLEWAANQIATLTENWVFRAPTYGHTLTPSLTVLTGRERVPSNLFTLSFDSAWANLGNTPLSGTVISGKLAFFSGIEPDYTTDARAALDFTQQAWGADSYYTLDLVLEVNATTNTEFTDWVNQNAGGASKVQRFIRLKATSPNAVAKYVQFDGAFYHVKAPAFSQQNKIERITLSLKTDYDPVSSNAHDAVIANTLASWT